MPSKAPTFVSLVIAGECPESWGARRGSVPLFDPSGYRYPRDCHHPHSVGWKWLTVDHCKGSIAPSKPPVFVSLINYPDSGL